MTEQDEEQLVIERMRKEAERYGLWAEVKEAYDSYRAAGDSPKQAAWCALYDWDI